MSTTEQTKAEVEAYWTSVYEPVRQPRMGVVLCLSGLYYFESSTRHEAWSAAAEYTHEHQNKVAELREEIFELRDRTCFLANWKELPRAEIGARTLQRLESALAELLKGTKEAERG